MCVEIAPPRRGAHVVGLGRDGDVDLGTARLAPGAFKVGAVVLVREANALLDPQFILGAARASVARGLVPAELFRLGDFGGPRLGLRARPARRSPKAPRRGPSRARRRAPRAPPGSRRTPPQIGRRDRAIRRAAPPSRPTRWPPRAPGASPPCFSKTLINWWIVAGSRRRDKRSRSFARFLRAIG